MAKEGGGGRGGRDSAWAGALAGGKLPESCPDGRLGARSGFGGSVAGLLLPICSFWSFQLESFFVFVFFLLVFK